MSRFASPSADQPPPSHLRASSTGGKSAAPALPPTLSPAKAAPPVNWNSVKRMARVKLNPTTRVASVLPCADAPQTNSFQVSSVPLAPTMTPSCAPVTLNADQHVVEAVHAAFEKTEAHLKAIEAKLNFMHEEMQRTASPVTSCETSVKNPNSNPAAPSFLSPLAPYVTNGPPSSKAAASHHLQPILPAMAAPLSPIPSAQASSSAEAAKRKTFPTAVVAVVSAVAAAPVAAKVHEQPHSQDHCFPVDDTNVLESPSDSNSSYSSSDNDASESTSASERTLPVGAPLSAGEPARPPAEAPAAAAEKSESSHGVAAPLRQGFGLKRVSHASAPPMGGATGHRQAVRFNNGDASTTTSTLQSSLDKYSAEVSGDTGETMTVGRHFRRISEQRSAKADATAYLSLGAAGSHALDSAQAANGIRSATRRQGSSIKHVRESFLAPIPGFDDLLSRTESGLFDNHDIKKLLLRGAPCSWLCCAALAISYVSGVPTPVEKLLRANRMGVHYISFPTITLAELFDVVNDYIHTRYHRTAEYNGNCTEDEFEDDEDAAQYLSEDELKQLANIHCEMATFDTDVLDLGSGEDIHGMGEHPPITSLAQFRKELLLHLEEESSMYIFNYDPHVLEQAQLRLRSNQCDTEEEAAAVMATARFPASASGLFGILLSFDPVKHEVRLRTPYLAAEHHPLRFDGEGEAGEGARVGRSMRHFASAFANLVMEEHVVSLQALYNSVLQVDGYSRLSRGFVRVFKSASFAPKVPSMFPLFVLDGSSAGGLITSVLDVKIAPHVLGLAMLHHLSVTFLLSDSARRKQSSRNLLSKANVCDVKLRGIPLTKVCQQLRLPLSMIVCESNRSSIAAAYVWYHLFLQQLQISKEVHIGLILPSRREGAADGQPNITDSEFLHHLQLMVQSESVMLISFDINVALNVRIDARREPAHFAIIIGVDEARGIVRLADVNVKRFRKTWHIHISRLYNAVMGYGYMVASKDRKVIKSLKGTQFQEDALQCARNFLPPPTPPAYQRFEYPSCPYPLTVLADAVERLGFPGTNVERFLNFCGFHISYFLSRDMPLEGAAIVIQNYSHYALDDAVSVTTTHYDYCEGNPPPNDGVAEAGVTPAYPTRSEADLLKAIQYTIAEPAKRKLIIKYDTKVVQANSGVWNGNEGSSFAFVIAYEAPTKMVVLSDASPSSFHRPFVCPLTLLFNAVCSWDSVVLRGRGSILLTTEVSQEYLFEDTKGYDMAHALVHHPFKPIFSAACSCLALASTEMMMNISTPTLLGGAPIHTDRENKKYRRYNNIFSAEDFLYALPSFSVCDWRTQSVDIRDIAGIANRAFRTLKLPLRAVNVLPEKGADPAALLRACSGVSGLLTITLVTYDTGVLHGVPGSSAGLVNRVHALDDEAKTQPQVPGVSKSSVGFVQLLEGDPCRWGACFERSAEELVRAVKGIYRVEEVVEDGVNG
ncbi:hypothetical protein LSCM1_06774 [Leishmania martiniquensis]|uniref:Uncharacterized protein n=1 Tax=Leishmania martiniquensis TaxID=1580590 RepID=A0A836GVW4_9TRYP|nr:hypothetical protein LSCM1_06774 [Leishmania martiniquensis]